MKRIWILLLVIVVLSGCSSENGAVEEEIEALSPDNSVIDTIVSKLNGASNDDELLNTVRSTEGLEEQQVYVLLENLFRLEEMEEKPIIPDYYYGIIVSAQRSEDMKTYEIELQVDPELTYLKILSIETNENQRLEDNRVYRVSGGMKKALQTIMGLD